MFRLGTWEGSLEGLTELRRQDSTIGSTRSRTELRHSDERLTVQNSGAYVYNPRLLTLSLGVTLGLAQDWLTIDERHRYDETFLNGYNTSASVLSGQPFSLNVFANRSQSSVSRELLGLSETVSESRGATLFARRLYVPSTLTVRQEIQQEESEIAGIATRRDDLRTSVRYEGQRGWTDQEMGIFYEFVDDSNRAFPELSSQSHEGQFRYGLDFGEELNRHWDSRLRLATRTGLIESTIGTLDESLRIDHTDRLRSNYRYLVTRTVTQNAETTLQSATANLRHQLFESLATTAGLDAGRESLVGGEKDTYRGRLDLAYTKRLPRGGRLNVGLGGSLQYEDDRFEVTDTPVSQETHTAATPFALPISLDNPLVITSTVVVTKTAVGPLPPGCIPPPGPPTPLTLGVDYTLRTTGDVTEIVPISCAGATAGINPGDTVAVDYRFAVAPSRTFMTSTWRADASVDYRWVRVFMSHEQSDQRLLSGREDHFLDDTRTDTVGAELRYDGERLRASLLGEARRYTSRRVSFDSLRGGALADYAILSGLTFRLSADETLTDYPGENRQTRSLATRAGLTYILGGLSADLSVGVRRLEDTLQPEEQIREARLLVRWLYRKIEISPALEYIERERGDTDLREYRVGVKTIRRF